MHWYKRCLSTCEMSPCCTYFLSGLFLFEVIRSFYSVFVVVTPFPNFSPTFQRLPSSISVNMWRSALLLLAAGLAVALARPHLKPLSTDMVNYINKINTTWKVIF